MRDPMKVVNIPWQEFVRAEEPPIRYMLLHARLSRLVAPEQRAALEQLEAAWEAVFPLLHQLRRRTRSHHTEHAFLAVHELLDIVRSRLLDAAQGVLGAARPPHKQEPPFAFDEALTAARLMHLLELACDPLAARGARALAAAVHAAMPPFRPDPATPDEDGLPLAPIAAAAFALGEAVEATRVATLIRRARREVARFGRAPLTDAQVERLCTRANLVACDAPDHGPAATPEPGEPLRVRLPPGLAPSVRQLTLLYAVGLRHARWHPREEEPTWLDDAGDPLLVMDGPCLAFALAGVAPHAPPDAAVLAFLPEGEATRLCDLAARGLRRARP